jgi:hypothetical protein
MRKVALGILTLGLVIGGNVAVWAGLNRPETTKSWTGGAINGVSFSPYSASDSPVENRHPSAEAITADLRVVASLELQYNTASLGQAGQVQRVECLSFIINPKQRRRG